MGLLLICIPCAIPEEIILPIVYALDPHHVLRRVNLERLVPTQTELIPAVLDHYRQRVRMTDEDGALPYGICFTDSPNIYITNGHHRWYVCRERGRKQIRIWIHFHSLSLREAIFASHRPAPVPKPAKRHAPPVNPRQMPLALQYATQ